MKRGGSRADGLCIRVCGAAAVALWIFWLGLEAIGWYHGGLIGWRVHANIWSG